MPNINKNNRRSWQPKPTGLQGGRTESTGFYQSKAWRKVRAVVITTEPVCRSCKEQGKVTAAQVVDHITPIRQGGAALDIANLQPLCNACHNKKSGKERHFKRGMGC